MKSQFIFFVFLFLVFLYSCKKDNNPPVAKFSIYPETGDTTSFFLFDASASFDLENPDYALEFRWDWNNDGIWDTKFSDHKKNVYKFPDPGAHVVSLQVRDLDNKTTICKKSLFTWGKNPVNFLTDQRDQQQYRIVEINGKWWMAENLNYGEQIPDSILPLNDGLIQKYVFNNENIKLDEGGYYTYYLWNEIMGYKPVIGKETDICPPGWRLPVKNDWEDLFNSYPPEFIKEHFGIGGFSSLNLSKSSYLSIIEKGFPDLDEYSKGIYWTSEFVKCDTCFLQYNPLITSYTEWEYDKNVNPGLYYILKKGSLPSLYTYYKNRFNNIALPVRCVK